MIQVENFNVLITGASGGIGSAILEEFIKLNVNKIYATGLELEKLKPLQEKYPEKVIPVTLDVSDFNSVKECIKQCKDVNVLINNAGIELKIPFIEERTSQAALFEMKVNYIGLIDMVNCFLPILKKSEHSSIVNILSMGSLAIVNRLGTYCASKWAAHVFTETIRQELEKDKITVIGVYPGYVNTKMVPEKVNYIKSEPSDIAKEICEGITAQERYIFPDQISKDFILKYPINTQFFD